MTQENNNSDKGSTDKNLPSQISLMARVLVGGYLLYISYSLVDSFINSQDAHKYMLGAFIAFFAIAGILLILFSGRDLVRGKYVNGKMDSNIKEETVEVIEQGERDAKEP